jgi:hypothetical protein
MCLCNRQIDPKSRRVRFIANLSLLLGLLPIVFRQELHVYQEALDAFCGFFLGISITANLCGLRCARREASAPKTPE